MTSRRFITRVVGLMFVVVPCAAAEAQPPGTAAPVVTETRRREILQAAEALTSETFADVVCRAEAGDVEAQVLAGIALEDGKVAPQDLNRAVSWMRSAAESNHPFAQNRLGWYYESGTGVPRDPQKAVEWFARAAAQGFAQAQSNLGWAYLQGDGVAENRVEGVRLLRLAAEQGNANGQFYLGLSCEFGRGIEKTAREAVGWYRKAAEQGHVDAQFRLGVAYEEGKGVRKDKDEAAKWYRKSSEQGYAIASFFYGWLYLEKPAPGMTDPLATGAAVDGLELSAAQGYPVAAFVLGEVFSYRLFPYHVRKDELEACSWYVIASNLDKQADWKAAQPEAVAAMRKDLPGRMTKIRKSLGATQSAECERRASDWLAAHPPRRQE